MICSGWSVCAAEDVEDSPGHIPYATEVPHVRNEGVSFRMAPGLVACERLSRYCIHEQGSMFSIACESLLEVV